jgi:hypothetical protein
MNNYRPTNYGNSYLDQNNRLGYSSVSKGYGYSNRSITYLRYRLSKWRSKLWINRIHARKLKEKVQRGQIKILIRFGQRKENENIILEQAHQTQGRIQQKISHNFLTLIQN